MTIGNRISVSGAGETLEGLAQGIDEEGRLIVLSDDGATRHVAAGDVSIVKGKSARGRGQGETGTKIYSPVTLSPTPTLTSEAKCY